MKDSNLDNMLGNIAQSSTIVLLALVLSKVFSYSYRIIIARYFGANIYGVLSLALVVIGFFVAFFTLGFPDGVTRFVALYRGKKEDKKIKSLLDFSSKILLIISIIASLICFFLSDFIAINIFHNPSISHFLKSLSIVIPFWIFAAFFLSIIRAYEKIGVYSIIENIIQNAGKVFFLILFILFGLRENAILFSFFAGIFLMFLSSYLYFKIKIAPRLNGTNQKLKKTDSSAFLSYSLPLMFLGVISTFLFWIDSFTIGFFKSTLEVGYYNAVVPIAILLSLTPQIFLRLTFPLITKEYSQKKLSHIKEVSKQISKWIFIINLPVFILMFLFPGAIINILFGEEYLIAITALRFLLVGSLFSSIAIISNNLLSMIGKSKLILIDIILSSILNLILNIWLVPKETIFMLDNASGINGAALATMLSIIFFNLLFMIQAGHYVKIIPLRRKMLNILLISLIPLFFILFIRKFIYITTILLILLTCSFFLFYLLLIFVFNALDKNDIALLKKLKNKIL